MNFTVVDKWNDMDFGGSGLVGTINLPREVIVGKLGESTQINSERIKERWLIKFEDGKAATIFKDYKCGDNEWCVGGFGAYDKKTKENLSLRAVKQLFNI